MRFSFSPLGSDRTSAFVPEICWNSRRPLRSHGRLEEHAGVCILKQQVRQVSDMEAKEALLDFEGRNKVLYIA